MSGSARAKEKADVITARDIKRYVRVAALANARKKQREVLRDRLVPRLEAGGMCDPKSPYELYILPVPKSKVPWREIAEKYIAIEYGAEAGTFIKLLEEKYKDEEKHLKTRPMVAELRDCGV